MGSCHSFFRFRVRAFRSGSPVSYTHLDVYKRQRYSNRLAGSFCQNDLNPLRSGQPHDLLQFLPEGR